MSNPLNIPAKVMELDRKLRAAYEAWQRAIGTPLEADKEEEFCECIRRDWYAPRDS